MKYFIKKEDRINVLLAVLLVIIIAANCIQVYNYKADERFEWSSGVLSAKGNVIQVSSCYFHHTDNWNYDVDKNSVLDDGWDSINYSENSKENAFYPDSLSITWFSYTEKKFYDGNFKLPYSVILEKAKQLRTTTSEYDMDFARENPNKIALQFLAEVMPKGKIIVWISDYGKKIKIGEYQAKPVNRTWHIFDDIQEKDTDSKIDIALKTALVMEKHPYMIDLTLADGFSLLTAEVQPFDQNNWSLESGGNKGPHIFSCIPADIRLSWGNDKNEFAAQISFKELETLSAFRKLDSPENTNPLMLELTVDNKNDSIHILLKREQKRIKIIPSYISVYPLAK